MDPVVVDTDVFSFLTKDDSRAAFYLPYLDAKRLCVCFQTVAELRLWSIMRRWGPGQHEAIKSRLERFVVLPYDEGMAQHWANITAHRRRLGRPIECGDAWIAASALRHNATLITHNAKDYEDIPALHFISQGS